MRIDFCSIQESVLLCVLAKTSKIAYVLYILLNMELLLINLRLFGYLNKYI